MNGGRLTVAAVLLAVVLLAAGWSVGRWRSARPADPPPPADAARRGAVLFQVHCAACHGPEGRGGEPVAGTRPRDFAARPWRFEATPESIRRVTLEGIAGTGMPSFTAALSGPDVDAVVAHVHRLATAAPAGGGDTDAAAESLREAGFTDLRGTDPPPLTLTAPDGARVKLSDLRGRLVLLHFWGTGCVHCIEEMPALDAFARENSGRMVVLHVCADDADPRSAQGLLDRLAPGARSHTDPGGLAAARFDVQTLPTVWLIGPDGEAVARASGARDWRSPRLARLLSHWLPRAGG